MFAGEKNILTSKVVMKANNKYVVAFQNYLTQALRNFKVSEATRTKEGRELKESGHQENEERDEQR